MAVKSCWEMASTAPVMYVGRCPAVEVDPDGLGEITVTLNDVINVPVDVAQALLQQPANWQTPPAPAPAPAPAPVAAAKAATASAASAKNPTAEEAN